MECKVKTLVIIMFVSAMLIISANFVALPITLHKPFATSQSIPLNTDTKPDIQRLKKSKNNRLPRWHRVIPGMFR
jgi:hypothetical protein